MTVEYSKSLEKQVEKLTDKVAVKRLLSLVTLLKEAKTLQEIPNVRPIKGIEGLYRITIGDYRLIIEPIKNKITVIFLKTIANETKKHIRGLVEATER